MKFGIIKERKIHQTEELFFHQMSYEIEKISTKIVP
jgi:hypothetical protein